MTRNEIKESVAKLQPISGDTVGKKKITVLQIPVNIWKQHYNTTASQFFAAATRNRDNLLFGKRFVTKTIACGRREHYLIIRTK